MDQIVAPRRTHPDAFLVRNAVFLEQIKPVLEIALELESKKRGGYFTVADSQSGNPLSTTIIGRVNQDNQIDYAVKSIKKGHYLAQHPSHFTSFDTREELGGAIRTQCFIFSFHGFSERMSEAMMLCLAVLCDELTETKAHDIAKKNKNMIFIKEFMPYLSRITSTLSCYV